VLALETLGSHGRRTRRILRVAHMRAGNSMEWSVVEKAMQRAP